MAQQENTLPFISTDDFLNDKLFMSGLTANSEDQYTVLEDSIAQLVQQGIFLLAVLKTNNEAKKLYFFNTKKGQAAVEAIAQGKWQLQNEATQKIKLELEFPNIYTLYEENIGPLTPIIADALKELDNLYSPEWIADAFAEASKNNVRKLKYIEAILQSWQTEGRNDRTDRGRSQKSKKSDDPERYVKGKYSDFIDH
jgi:DnaD/phage-associated family protein